VLFKELDSTDLIGQNHICLQDMIEQGFEVGQFPVDRGRLHLALCSGAYLHGAERLEAFDLLRSDSIKVNIAKVFA
jgi:hypothetical protein